MVSNGERLEELSEKAANSQDAATLQVLKTMDSIEAKTQQLQTTLQSLYTDTGIEKFYKLLLDGANNVITSFSEMPKIFNLPILAIVRFATQFYNLANVVVNAFTMIKTRLTQQKNELNAIQKIANNEELSQAEELALKEAMIEKNKYQELKQIRQQGNNELLALDQQAGEQELNQKKLQAEQQVVAQQALNRQKKANALGMGVTAIGTVTSLIGNVLPSNATGWKGGLDIGGGLLQGLGTMAMGGFSIPSIIMGSLTALTSLISGISTIIETTEEKIKRLNDTVEETSNKKLIAKDELDNLQDYGKRLQELSKTQNDSEEAHKEWLDLNNEIAAKYPELISYIDTEGNSIVALGEQYKNLAQQKQEAYNSAFIENGKAQIASLADTDNFLRNLGYIYSGETYASVSNNETDKYAQKNAMQTALYRGLQSDQKNFNLQPIINQLSDQYYNDSKAFLKELYGEDYNLDIALKKWADAVGELGAGVYQDAINAAKTEKDKEKVLAGAIIGYYNTFNDVFDKSIERFNSISDGIINAENSREEKEVTAIENLATSSAMSILNYYKTALQNLYHSLNSGEVQSILSLLGKDDASQLQHDLVTNYFDSLFLDEKGEYFKRINAGENPGEVWEDFTKKGLDNVSTYLTNSSDQYNLSGFDTDKLNSAYENIANYSLNQLNQLLNIENLLSDENLTDIQQTFKDSFEKNNAKTIESFKSSTSKIIPDDLMEKFITEVAASQLQGIADKYKEIEKKDLDSSTYTKQVNALNEVYNSILLLPDELQQQALTAAEKADLTSLTGIYNFIEDLKTADIDLDQTGLVNAITNFGETLSINIATEFDSYTQSIISRTEEFGKALSSASKGLDIKAASELANKLKIDLQDFSFKDGKFFLDDVNKLQEAYIKFNEDLEDRLASRTQDVTSLLDQYNIADIFNTANTYLKNGQATSGTIEESIQMALESLNYVPDLSEIDRLANAYRSYYDQAIAAGVDIETYIEQQLQNGAQELEIIKEAVKYSTNVALIESGNLEAFLNNLGYTREDYADFDTIINSLQSGMFSNLPDNITPYIQTLWKAYQNINKSLYDTALKTLDGRKELVTVTPQNKEFLRKYGKDDAGQLVGDNIEELEAVYLDFANESLESIRNDITNALQNGELTQDEASSLLKTLHDEEYKNNLTDVLDDVTDNYNSVSYDIMQSLAKLLNVDIDELLLAGVSPYFDPVASINDDGTYKINLERLDAFLTSKYNELSDDSYNKIRAQLEQAKYEQNYDNVIREIITKRNEVTKEDIGILANAMHMRYEELIELLHLQENDDGTYRMSLVTLVNNFKNQMNDTVLEYIASEIDNVISSITGLSGSQSKGFTNLAEMQKYVSELNKLGITQSDGSPLNFKTLFEYDKSLHAYRLSTEGLIKQVTAMENQLISLTGEQREIAEQLIADTTRQFAEGIDTTALVNAIGTNQFEDTAEIFKKAITDYNAVLLTTALSAGRILNADQLMKALTSGGADAIAAMQVVAEAQGKQLTAEQAQTAWRAQVANYVNAIDTLVAQRGEIVDKTTADIIKLTGGQVSELGNSGTYLVQTAANLYEAYNLLLVKMQATGEATLADLNKVAGLMLDNRDDEQKVIDALGDAAGMTYSRFGEILTTAGIQLTESLVNQLESSGIIQGLGGNKMRITDFKAFANIMNWDANSEEYVSAFKSYNDSLIEVNRKAERNILEEAENVAKAKTGDWINLTQLTNELQEIYNRRVDAAIQANAQGGNIDVDAIANPLNTLNEALIKYGAYIDDGILKITENADILNIVNEIEQVARESGGLISNELAELADAIADVLSNYTNLITNGIKGSLNNAQANELQSFANSQGLGKLDFSKTKEGLKLSAESATELYNTISKIDTLQGQLVFDELRSSLEASNEGLANISTTSATITRVQKQLQENQKEIVKLQKESGNETKISNIQKENRELQDQLNLYNKIAVAQSSDSKSFNFMDRKLPDAMQGPINYWNSVGEAYKVMNESASSGYMDIEDFYNIVNEMTNLAELSGQNILFMGQEITGDLQTTSELIQKGFNALSNVDGEGVKIDLSKLAANLQTGANEMGEGFDDAIKSMARSQIAMLDSMINMLEAVVAMQQLGDIAGDDNVIDVSELFNIVGDNVTWSDKAAPVMENIKKQAEENDNLKTALDSLFLNGHSLWKYITNESNELNDLGEEGREKFAAAMTKLYQLSQTNDFDLKTIQQSVLELLQSFDLTDLLDGFSYDKEADISYIATPIIKAQVDWSQWNDDKLQKLSEEIGNVNIKTKEQANELLRQYVENPTEFSEKPEQLEYILRLTNTIIVEPDEEGKEQYFFQGQPVNKEDIPKFISALSSSNGFENFNTNLEDRIYTFTGKIYGNLKYEASIRDNQTTYDFGNGPIPADSPEEALKREYEKNKLKIGGTGDEPIFEEFEDYKIRISGNITTEVNAKNVDTSGVIDPIAESIRTAFTQDTAIGEAIGTGITNAVISGKLNRAITIPQVDTSLALLNIVKVDSARFAQTALNTLASAFGVNTGSNLAIESATAAINNLDINNIVKSHYDSTIKLTEDIAQGEANVTNMTVGASNFTAAASLQALQGLNFATTSSSLLGIANSTNNIGHTSFSNFGNLSNQLDTIKDQVDVIWKTVQNFANQTFTVNMVTVGNDGENTSNNVTTNYNTSVNVDTASAVTSTTALSNACKTLAPYAISLASKFTAMISPMAAISRSTASDKILAVSSAMRAISSTNATNRVTTLADAMGRIPDVASKIRRLAEAISNIPSTKTANLTLRYNVSRSNAKGNIGGFANAKGTGDALAKGQKTLMGELGPELVVSHGRYFLVGANGAEFVNLDKDAIVFNHKQTKRLMEQGAIGSRGRPFTNEANALAFARGTIPPFGPAKISARPQDDVGGTGVSKSERIVTRTSSERISSVHVSPIFSLVKLFSYAKGNVGGPALASASAALAALKQLRAMWQSMLEASAKDLGALAGRGGKGGGGGGGGGGSGAENEPSYYIHDLEIWYNLLRQIDKLEKDITYQESLQQKIESDRVANGKALYTSQKKELDYLSAEVAKQKQLSILQEKYYLKQIEEINNSPFSRIFTFNEEGLMQYNNSLDDFINEQTKNNSYYFKDGKLHIQGTSYVRDEEGNIVTDEAGNKQIANFNKLLDIPKSGLEFLALLNSTDEYERPIYTAEELVEVLKAFNFGEYLQFDSSGKRIDESDENAAVTILQTFYEQMDSIREDTDSLYDSVEESREKILELESKRNEILQKIIDNQLAVEQSVLNAIESREQSRIDEAQKERDALEEANQKFLDGLNEELNREKQMYQNQQDQTELTKLQRQLAILQRSGGSAAQIRNLQDQITSKQKDMYFDAQQQQIDAIKEASDKQIERLDAQIDLMTETLEYQKEHGLLWEEVYQVMAQSPEKIRQFIMEYTPDFESNSALQVAEDVRDLDLKIQEWVSYREDAKEGTDPLTADITHDWDTTKEAMGPMTAEEEAAAKAEFDKQMDETSDPNLAQAKAVETVQEKREENRNEQNETDTKSQTQQQENQSKDNVQTQPVKGQIFGQYYAHNAPNLDRSSRFKNNPNDYDNFIFGDEDKVTSVDVLGYKDDMYYISQNGVQGWISAKAFADSYVSSTRKALEAAKAASILKRYNKGGEIDYTGLAWVDGTKKKPETILSAEQTEYLKHDLLNGVNTLDSITADFRNLARSINNGNINTNMTTNTDSVNIERVELTMQVNSIANDYDARQAGSAALEEIMRIARKTGTRGINRR